MKGTEKQIAWAEDIKETYIKQMDEAKAYYRRILESGSDFNAELPCTAMAFVRAYHPDADYDKIKKDMRNTEIYKEFRSCKSGSPEKTAARKVFKKAAAEEALKRLEKAVLEKCSEESAAEWIESRIR